MTKQWEWALNEAWVPTRWAGCLDGRREEVGWFSALWMPWICTLTLIPQKETKGDKEASVSSHTLPGRCRTVTRELPATTPLLLGKCKTEIWGSRNKGKWPNQWSFSLELWVQGKSLLIFFTMSEKILPCVSLNLTLKNSEELMKGWFKSEIEFPDTHWF